jgi:nucleoid-associated protein YgaU
MVGFMYTVNLTTVDVKYNRFDSTGIPIRAEVNLQMKVLPDDLLGALPTNPTSGGLPGRNTHLVREDESLQSIAQQYYGRPGVWRKIAEINGITNPRRLRPGTNLYLPGPGELTPAGSR